MSMIAIRPTMPDPEQDARSVRQSVRWMLLHEEFGDGLNEGKALTEFMTAQLGDELGELIGIPDVSANTLSGIARQLSTPGLYGLGSPNIKNLDPRGAELVSAVEDAGLWTRMQYIQGVAVGMGDAILAVDLEEGSLCYRTVKPQDVYAKTLPHDASKLQELWELRVRDLGAELGIRYCWDRYRLSADGNAVFDVVTPGTDGSSRYLPVTNLAVPGAPVEGLTGVAYRWRYADGKPFIPYQFYARTDSGSLWHDAERRGATVGSLNSIVYASFTGACALQASHETIVAVGVEPPGANTKMADRGVEVSTIRTTPGSMLFLRAQEGVNNASITQVGAGANLSVLSQFAAGYAEAQLSREGISSDQVTRNTANPTSAAALSITDAAKRRVAKMVRPFFRRADLQMLSKSAALLKLPEKGYVIAYQEIPETESERTARRDELTWRKEQGLISTVGVYLAVHPEETAEMALAALKKVKEEECMLEATPETAPESETVSGPETPEGSSRTSINLTSTDIASIVTVNEARASQGLPPLATDGNLTVAEYQAKHSSTIAAAANAVAGDAPPQP